MPDNGNPRDLKDAHFSRYGEVLVSYELAKRGWNVYGPVVHDEYVDFVASGFVCEKCREMLRTVTPQLICPCGKTVSSAEKKDCLSVAVCVNPKCDALLEGQDANRKCPRCGEGKTNERHRFLACFRECDRPDLLRKQIKAHKCVCTNAECQGGDIGMIFRTVQVKSSRKEEGGSYAFNPRLRDLIPDIDNPDPRHFFVWCLVDDNDKAEFYVLSAPDFAKTMGEKGLSLPSFLKDQGREHFVPGAAKWKEFSGKFDKLSEELAGDFPVDLRAK